MRAAWFGASGPAGLARPARTAPLAWLASALGGQFVAIVAIAAAMIVAQRAPRERVTELFAAPLALLQMSLHPLDDPGVGHLLAAVDVFVELSEPLLTSLALDLDRRLPRGESRGNDDPRGHQDRSRGAQRGPASRTQARRRRLLGGNLLQSPCRAGSPLVGWDVVGRHSSETAKSRPGRRRPYAGPYAGGRRRRFTFSIVVNAG